MKSNIKLLLGIGDWGLGIGDWGLGSIPNPQSPIPNPQSPIENLYFILYKLNFFFNYIRNINIINKIIYLDLYI